MPDGLLVVGTSDPIVLRSPGAGVGDHLGRRASSRPAPWCEPGPDQPVVLELRCGTDDLSPHPVAEPQRRSRAGRASWSRWLAA